jgi:Ala-tRNA(Pro) deacylase
MACRERVIDYLSDRGVPFRLRRHRPTHSAQQLAAAEHVPGVEVAKTVLVFADAMPVVLVLPASYRVVLPQVAEILGARDVRLATESELLRLFPDCRLGGAVPFANLYGLPAFVDSSLAADDEFVAAAGTPVDAIAMKFDDYRRLVHPRISHFARHG